MVFLHLRCRKRVCRGRPRTSAYFLHDSRAFEGLGENEGKHVTRFRRMHDRSNPIARLIKDGNRMYSYCKLVEPINFSHVFSTPLPCSPSSLNTVELHSRVRVESGIPQSTREPEEYCIHSSRPSREHRARVFRAGCC